MRRVPFREKRIEDFFKNLKKKKKVRFLILILNKKKNYQGTTTGPIASAAVNSFLFNNTTKNYQLNSNYNIVNQNQSSSTSSSIAHSVNNSPSSSNTLTSNGLNLLPEIVRYLKIHFLSVEIR